MNIGIIVYSQTGNTLHTAGKLREKLEECGHTAEIERLKPKGEVKPGQKDICLEKLPDIVMYDCVVFCSPVQAFSLPPVMSRYLRQIESLEGKKTACFVTMHFPFDWMGGNRTIRQMVKICTSKGADVEGTGIINWSGKNREELIESMTYRLCGLF